MLVRGEAHNQSVNRVLAPGHSQLGTGCHLLCPKGDIDENDRGHGSQTLAWVRITFHTRRLGDSVCLGCGLGFCILTSTSDDSASSDHRPPLKKHWHRKEGSQPRRLGTRGGFQYFKGGFCWQWWPKPRPGQTSKAALGSIWIVILVWVSHLFSHFTGGWLSLGQV